MGNSAAFIGSRKENHWLTQRQTNREERKIGEWGNHCETDWLRTIDATRKEENHWWKKADEICEHLSGGQRRQEKQTSKMGHQTKIKWSCSVRNTVVASISLKNNGKLILVSSYCPKGNCNKEDVELLFQLTSSNFIIGGYVNNHHSLWEFHATLNRAGRAIAAALHDQNQVCLLTSSDLQTRLYLVSGLQSTIDLTFVHQDLPNAAIYGGPNIGRDRMFFCHSLNESRAPSCWFSELN